METLHDLEQATLGRVLPEGAGPQGCPAAAPLGRIETDSRQIQPGDVFWSLQGPNHGRASSVEEALRHGAAGAVVPRDAQQQLADWLGLQPGAWLLEVEDTYRALVQWATWKRERFTGTLVAVSGGVGSSTARRMIHAVLGSRLAGTACPRNVNNRLGVPLGTLELRPQHDYAVLELAAGPAGEISELAGLVRPKVAVILPAADTHAGGCGNRQGAADAKGDLLAALPADGHAVLADDPWLSAAAARCAAPITWIGASSRCHLRAVQMESARGRLSFRVAVGEPSLVDEPAPGGIAGERFSVPAWGPHHLRAALAAVALGRMTGFDLAHIAAALENFHSVPVGCEVVEIRGATILRDGGDCGPAAMRAAIELVEDLESSGRRIVVCGSVSPRDAQAAAAHWQLGKQIVELGGATLLIACGPMARHVTAGARAAGMVRSRAIPCDSLADALPYLGQAILPGDVVLVKTAEGMDLERVAEALGHYPQRRIA
jgi:UDP-N-acetylmuramoyl-tripeptide--D-alanyl-D-alanine ligase